MRTRGRQQLGKIRRLVMKHLLWSFHLDGAYYSAWDLCSCALLQLNNNRLYSIVSELNGNMLVSVVLK